MKNKSTKLQAQNAMTGSALLAALLLVGLVSISGCRNTVNKGGVVDQRNLGTKTADLAASIDTNDPNDGWTAAEQIVGASLLHIPSRRL